MQNTTVTQLPTKTLADGEKGLNYLSWVFIVLGGLSTYESLVAFLKDPIPSINFLVVFVLIGFGLKKRLPAARIWANRTAGFVFFFLSWQCHIQSRQQGSHGHW